MNNDLLVISYNEGEQNFYQAEIDDFCNEVSSINPSVIIICTQKSKSQVAIAIPGKSYLSGSNSTKHFPHVFGKYLLSKKYKLLYKKDASFLLRGVTENNNVRTRIYMKVGTDIHVDNSKLSKNTIGQVTKMSVNRQAIYTEITYLKKTIIIINTELANYNNGNFGVGDRQKEFISLIKEFDLAEKSNMNCNIIFTGSLNFKLNPIEIINNEYKRMMYSTLENYITEKYNSNPSNLMKFNELKIYLNNLIKKINDSGKCNETENSTETIECIIKKNRPDLYKSLIEKNKLYISLLSDFSNSMDKSGMKLTCDYDLDNKNYRVVNPLKMGSIGKTYATSFNSGHAEYKKYNNTKLGVVKGATIGSLKGTTTLLNSSVKQIIPEAPRDVQRKHYKLPSMCDRILFSLSKKKPIYFKKFNVFKDLKKSKNRIVYSIFSLNGPPN